MVARLYMREYFLLGISFFFSFFFSVFFSALLPHPRHLIILFSAFSVLLCSFLFSFFLGGEGGKGPDRLSSLSPDKNEKLSHDQKLSLLTKKNSLSLSPDKTFSLSLSLSLSLLTSATRYLRENYKRRSIFAGRIHSYVIP